MSVLEAMRTPAEQNAVVVAAVVVDDDDAGGLLRFADAEDDAEGGGCGVFFKRSFKWSGTMFKSPTTIFLLFWIRRNMLAPSMTTWKKQQTNIPTRS